MVKAMGVIQGRSFHCKGVDEALIGECEGFCSRAILHPTAPSTSTTLRVRGLEVSLLFDKMVFSSHGC